MLASVKSNKVEKFVRQKIVSGGWPAGAKVPSDAELSAQLGVSDGVACGNVGVVFRAESMQGMMIPLVYSTSAVPPTSEQDIKLIKIPAAFRTGDSLRR